MGSNGLRRANAQEVYTIGALADILAEMAEFGLGNPDDLTGQIGGFDKF
jgi:hypothetical protein